MTMLRLISIAIVLVAVLVAQFIPAVNRATLWLGVPPMVLWPMVGIALLTPLLAMLEFTRKADDEESPS
jgi:hypothetical protein